MAYSIGQDVGNYRLLKKIGAGGFAEVYRGEHIHLGTQAAIKILYAQLANPHEIDNFRQEARTIAQLAHPNIIRVLDFNIVENTPYFVMDLAPYGSLRDRHTKGEQLPLATVISYINQAAAALQFAHERKVIHRDIKPENLLIGRQKEILVADFGIAVIAQSTRLQSAQDMAGTITYMAPEQIQAHPRQASDQYSLAITAYEWLCGQRPFSGTFTEIAVKHTNVPPPPLSQFVTITPATEQVIMKALEKDPEKRYPRIIDFARALEQSQHTSPITLTQQDEAGQDSTVLRVPPTVAAPPIATVDKQSNATPPQTEQSVGPNTTATPNVTPPPPPPPYMQPYAGPPYPYQGYGYGYNYPSPYGYGQLPQTGYGARAYPLQPPQSTLPFLRGKPRWTDLISTFIYALLPTLFCIYVANSPLLAQLKNLSTTTATNSAALILLSIVVGYMSWALLGGALFGSWRSALTLLVGNLIATIVLLNIIKTNFTTSYFLIDVGVALVGLLLGLFYERRRYQRKIHSFFAMFLGTAALVIIIQALSTSSTTYTNAGNWAIYIGCIAPLIAIVPFSLEIIIGGIAKIFRH
jgi:serine/threonine protein kinase